jgi:predicted transposase YdaD
MEQRLSGPRARNKAKEVWAAAYLLAGLRYSPDFTAQLFRGVLSMKESSTYQAILQEGRATGLNEGAVIEARKFLRKVGNDKLGQPDARTTAAIEQIDDVSRLEELFDRLSSVESWQELLGQSTPSRAARRKRSP